MCRSKLRNIHNSYNHCYIDAFCIPKNYSKYIRLPRKNENSVRDSYSAGAANIHEPLGKIQRFQEPKCFMLYFCNYQKNTPDA